MASDHYPPAALPGQLSQIAAWLKEHAASELSQLDMLRSLAEGDSAFPWRSYRGNHVVSI